MIRDNPLMPGEIDEAMRSAVQHHQSRRYAEAERIYRGVLAQNPNHADAVYLLSVLAYQAGKFEDARALVLRAISINSSVAQYHSHLGVVLHSLGRTDDSIKALRHAIGLSPKSAAGHANLALSLCEKGLYAEAKSAYLKAIELGPEFPEPRLNLGTLQLLTGDFAGGWENYEYRTKCSAGVAARQFSQPRWDGGELKGQTILIHAEQGFGDTIHFARYLPMVAARGGRVVLQCRPELGRLLQGFPGVSQIVTGNDLPNFEVECPLLGLPRVFGTRLDSIPAPVPYLKVDESLSRAWKHRLQPHANEKRIGVAWAGSPTNIGDRKRSISLSRLLPLAQIRGVRFFSLQKGPAGAQAAAAPFEIIDFSSELRDFADTAALISELDMVIAVDTAVAHLAGALGKPVWILLPFYPDWRWLLDREDSPWYPTVRLFRQSAPGDWGSVIQRLADALGQK